MSVMYSLTAIALLLSIFVIYNIIAKEKPQTLGTIYAGALTCSEEDINIIEVNIYSNENKNGIPCYEVLWNGYTDYVGGNIKGFGIQTDFLPEQHYYTTAQAMGGSLSDVSPEIVEIKGAKMYYTDDLGTSSYITTEMPDELYFDIDGAFYKYQFQTFEREVYSNRGWNLFNVIVNNTTTEKVSYNYYTLFDYIIKSALKDSAKETYSEFAINMLDLDKYLKIYYQDDDTQYKPLPKTSTMYKLFKIKVNYSKDGMTKASQSMFKQFKGNSSWDYYANTGVEEYWNAYAELSLTEANVNFVYNEAESAYYITLDEKFSEYLKGLSNAEISIDLDLTTLDFEIYGIDLQNFDFKIESFEISTTSTENFKIYNSNACSLTPTLKAV